MRLASPSLSRWERVGVISLIAFFIAFGALVEIRSAFLTRRMGDLSVYLRSSWAVRSGANCYDVTDENGWHYHYPPLFAILLTPLADPPPTADHAGYLNYAVSVAIFYVVNLLLLGIGVHWLASALEATSSHDAVRDQETFSRRWWLLRLLPVLICLPSIAHTLMRGQANLFVLVLICGLTACLIRGQRLSAGVCLAGAICLKIIPGYLLLVPLWRRDTRCMTGCALGLVIGLGIIPAAVLGPGRAMQCYVDMKNKLIEPALADGADASRSTELLNVTATDSQSFLAAMHNTIYFDPLTRPAKADLGTRIAHWSLAALFTVLTLLSTGGKRTETGSTTTMFAGALTLIMILCSPVCHTHYFALEVPLVMGLIANRWESLADGTPPLRTLALGRGLMLLMALQFVGHTVPQLPGCQLFRDTGLALYTALALWIVAFVTLRSSTANLSHAESRSLCPSET